MITLGDVQQILAGAGRQDLFPQAPLLLQIATIYINDDAGFEGYVDVALQEIANDHVNLPVGLSLPRAVRDRFIASCENNWISNDQQGCRAQAMALQVAGPPPPPPRPKAQHENAEYFARLRRLRTRTARDRGRCLTVAAQRMAGWFRWVPSGPVTLALIVDAWYAGQVQSVGPMYGPKEHWPHNQGQRRNDFAMWVNGIGPRPGPLSHMNCWEAVLFSACQANLVTPTWLQVIHRHAAVVNEFNAEARGTGEENYDRALSQTLGFLDSVPFDPHAGLVPQEGDVIYWDRTDHVAIALGRRWVNGRPDDRMMSLWHNNGGTFSALTLEDLPNGFRTGFRFRPCPF